MAMNKHHQQILSKLIRNEFDRKQQSWEKDDRDDLIALADELDLDDLKSDMINDL